MDMYIYWQGPGLYASRGRDWEFEVGGGSYVETIKVESQADARNRGYGTAHWYDKPPTGEEVTINRSE